MERLLAQRPHQARREILVVVDQQDYAIHDVCLSVPIVLPVLRCRSVAPTAASCVGLSVDRQPDDESGSPADLGLEIDRSPVLIDHDRMGQRESLAGSSADLLGGEEEVEDPRADVLGDARAGVFHADFRVAASDRVRTVMTPLPSAPLCVASAMAWAALTTRFSTTLLMSVGRQWTAGSSGSKSVTTSATYFHSLWQRVIAPAMTWFRSTACFPPVAGVRELLHGPDDVRHVLHALQRLLDGLGDFAGQVVEVGVAELRLHFLAADRR